MYLQRNDSKIDGYTEEFIYGGFKSVLSMFHSPYMYEETVITSDLNGLLFTTKGKAEKSLGWKELYVTDKIEEEDDQEKHPCYL